MFITPPGRMVIAAAGSRALLRWVGPVTIAAATYTSGCGWPSGSEASGAANLSGAPWMIHLARALGASIGHGVDLHTIPPVTGLLTVGDGASIEPEVDLTGWWIDGDIVHIGAIVIKRGATIGARSTLMPGAVIGRDAEVAAGSAVFGKVKARQQWPDHRRRRRARRRIRWPDQRPARRAWWVPLYITSSFFLAAVVPLISLGAGSGRHRYVGAVPTGCAM